MAKRPLPIKVPRPRSSSDTPRQSAVDVEHLKGIAQTAIKGLFHPDPPSQRAALHRESIESADNLGTFIGRTTPTVEEVAAIIDDGCVVARVMEIFNEQIAFAQSVNDLKGWLPDKWNSQPHIKEISAQLREPLILRVRAAIGLALLDVWTDSVGQPVSSTKLSRAEREYSERGRRVTIERKSDVGKRGKARKPRDVAREPVHETHRQNLIKAIARVRGMPSEKQDAILNSKKALAQEVGVAYETLRRAARNGGWDIETLIAETPRSWLHTTKNRFLF